MYAALTPCFLVSRPHTGGVGSVLSHLTLACQFLWGTSGWVLHRVRGVPLIMPSLPPGWLAHAGPVVSILIRFLHLIFRTGLAVLFDFSIEIIWKHYFFYINMIAYTLLKDTFYKCGINEHHEWFSNIQVFFMWYILLRVSHSEI